MHERGTLVMLAAAVVFLGLERPVSTQRLAITERCLDTYNAITIRATARNAGCQSQRVLECCGHGSEPLGDDDAFLAFLRF
jgi:hypothetical protein